MEDRGHHVAIDVEAMASNIGRKLSGNLVLSPNCSIFRIPSSLSRYSENAFVPDAFSIGPFHRDNPKLKPREKIKQKYLLDLTYRLSNQNFHPHPISTPDVGFIKKFIEAISNAQSEARDYYAEPVDMEEDEFIEMLVLDGCFIIELFRKKAFVELRDKDDPIFTISCMLEFLYHDLILLENQIPWFVLEILFDLTEPTPREENFLVKLAIQFFPTLLKCKELPTPAVKNHESKQNNKSKHILDLLRNSLVSNAKKTKQSQNEWQHIPSAKNLLVSGIRFREDPVADTILDITFNPRSGVMSIPPLLIQDTTETVFRNLISLEQCCPNYKPKITCYAILLDNLISTSTDVQLLDHNVIVNWLKIDEVIGILKTLDMGCFIQENYYYQLTCNVNIYCTRRWPRYRALFMQENSPPWVVVSFIAGATALICAFLQTLFTIMNK